MTNNVLIKRAGERGGDIVTQDTFEDFELAWEWRISPGGNNGVKYLVTEDRPSAPGHEYQMIDEAPGPGSKLEAKHMTGSFYDVLAPDSTPPVKPAGEWNTSRIVVLGNHVEHWLNGSLILAYELGSPSLQRAIANSKFKDSPGFGLKIRGRILLTDHSDECAFRNIFIREFQSEPEQHASPP